MHHRPAISDPEIVYKSENKESLQEAKKETKMMISSQLPAQLAH
jgi:hypothetical protein